MKGNAIFPGKQEICCTELSFFTDFAGIGNDPLYKRYDSVYSVVRSTVPEKYLSFLAQPYYSEDEDKIHWYVEKWHETPRPIDKLQGEEQDHYEAIKNDTIDAYKEALRHSSGDANIILTQILKYIKDEYIYCYDEKVVLTVWGMSVDTRLHETKGSVVYVSPEDKKRFTVTFDVGVNGDLYNRLDAKLSREDGKIIAKEDLPKVNAHTGYEFKEWQPSPFGYVVHSDVTFKAIYIKVENPVDDNVDRAESQQIPTAVSPVLPKNDRKFVFLPGDYGTLDGNTEFVKEDGYTLQASDFPQVRPNKGYEFNKWSFESRPNESRYTATYTRLPWYKRFWLWITELDWRGCLKWLLLLVLLFILLFLLLRACNSCTHHAEENGVVPIDSIKDRNGKIVDDNGHSHNIIGDDGKLPEGTVVAPITDEDGNMPPIGKSPDGENIVANRLNIYFENDNANLNQFAQDFKKAYPQDEYTIIGCDRNVKMVQIQVPTDQRDRVRDEMVSKLPRQKFFVVDEAIFQLNGYINNNGTDAGWHLRAVNVTGGWKYTKGSANVTVAVVDDGIDYSHPMFTGRIVSPYNVFTQSNTLSRGEGHGTHVAGLAVGSTQFYSQGASGMAPNCKLMPVQVFDNNYSTFSSVTSGIMYAVHKGADVINVSIGPNLEGLNSLSEGQQALLAQTRFKNEERVWKKIIAVANKKNSIIVFAAGNNDILTKILPECRTNQTINVSAVNRSLAATQFTNYGSGSNISAPGEDIYSSFPVKSFRFCDGTSMAAPIVSGTIALMKSLKKNITVTQALGVLQASGRSIQGNVPPMLQVDKALVFVRSGRFPNPIREKGLGDQPVIGDGDYESGGTGNGSDENMSNGANPRAPDRNTNYDEVRKLIRIYKEKIRELEKQLPNGK
ncbi:S8 family peptidase [Prevotella lacticifex]|uniref:Peptidase S8/S53 domain-containing protein n=1 Tax=Prevotella lacticifex TaxID=2854755 RepID=A0A9R1C8H3_9BACT|nr:S8 family serine peptidase [Prevotella lacticifex]GJG37618.1 hypothetical protein PRLR5003_27750 [Prevotella lacticifex]GJG41037.1 hypothetical protein PRLR5019_30080 [Prevotella lacticifex]GJG43491.1 hypothetical protein PRLR5025_22770 [Prevotella lacticifex]GJG47273.1 hypothetical protein PRLR5027_28680 [Prevotella lacticifex]GJG50074.1 hypothetical protein PRLR5052_24870 [Prevotella lacticifex]